MVSAKMFTKKLSRVLDGAELSESDVHADAGVDIAEGRFEDAQDTFLHPEACKEEGGFGFHDRELMETQRAAILELAKDLGRKLLTGHINLTSTTLPVKMFSPRSYLEKLADEWLHPTFLRRAALAADPVERMKLLVCWFVAGLQHVYEDFRKPFNPILGETWQATLPQDGTQLFVEQISHHPPVSAFQMQGPDGLFTFHGTCQPDASWTGNNIKLQVKGHKQIEFRDGGQIDIISPIQYIKGVLYAAVTRGEFQGVAKFVDRQNQLSCELHFGKVEGHSEDLLQRADSISGQLCHWQSPSPQASDSAAQILDAGG
eukprot:jgi/Astpho2/4009/Aster-01170